MLLTTFDPFTEFDRLARRTFGPAGSGWAQSTMRMDAVRKDDEVVLHMSALEKAEGFHGDIRIPLSAITAVRVVDTAWPELRGVRAPGTGVPDVIAVGTRRGGFGKDFAAVHGKGPAVVVELEGAEYGCLIVTCDDADAVASAIRAATGTG